MPVYPAEASRGLAGNLGRRDYVSAVLMDLSKAFDCLPHDRLRMKLQAYGLSVKACALISSYLSGRRQQVRLGPHCSDWCDIIKGSHKALFSAHFSLIYL